MNPLARVIRTVPSCSVTVRAEAPQNAQQCAGWSPWRGFKARPLLPGGALLCQMILGAPIGRVLSPDAAPCGRSDDEHGDGAPGDGDAALASGPRAGTPAPSPLSLRRSLVEHVEPRDAGLLVGGGRRSPVSASPRRTRRMLPPPAPRPPRPTAARSHASRTRLRRRARARQPASPLRVRTVQPRAVGSGLCRPEDPSQVARSFESW